MILLGGDPLSRFLNAAADRPWAWGEFDCLLWLADWIFSRRGVDPASGLRGTYATMLGAARIVKAGGGMARLVESRIAPHGISRVSVAARGDIAVVRVAGDGGEHFGDEAGAILLGGTAALICEGGLMFAGLAAVPVVAAWRV